MKRFRYEDMHGGWFVGAFEPTAFSTTCCEVSYKLHPKGEKWEAHYHEHLTEVNLLVVGRMILQGEMLTAGDIFVLGPREVADPEFLEDCGVVCVKVPGVKGDKIIV